MQENVHNLEEKLLNRKRTRNDGNSTKGYWNSYSKNAQYAQGCNGKLNIMRSEIEDRKKEPCGTTRDRKTQYLK